MSTNCEFPPELDDKQLLMYLDGGADRETVLHLEKCSYCRQRAKALDGFQKHLTARLYRATCPSSMELGDYHLRLLPPSQMLIVAQHVRECPHCAGEVAELESFLSELKPTQEASLQGKAKVLIARFLGGHSENSSLAPSFAALRGEAKGPVILEADGLVITLDIQPGPNEQVSILGQVAAEDQDRWTGAVVEVQQADTPPRTATLDDLGAFRFAKVDPGSVQMTITSSDGTVVQIPNLDIVL